MKLVLQVRTIIFKIQGMKTTIIPGIIVILLTMLFPPKDMLTGRWATKPSEKGNVTSVVFREDGSFEGFINRKPFTSGKYTLRDSVINFTDNGCNGIAGIYKVSIFQRGDSMRWVPITDSCEERKQGIARLVLGRVKQVKEF